MDVFFFRPDQYESLYNCTGFDIDAIPFEQRRFVPEAIVNFILCAVFYILYIPCMVSIWRHISDNTCYKLLFFIGVMDLLVLWILGFLHSILSLTGSVYCSHPTLIYFAGGAALTGWIVESSADILLAVDRCLEIISPEISEMLFHGYRLGIWLTICCLYGFYWIFFEKPLLFNGIFFAWFFNPYAGYREDTAGTYNVKIHGVHDYSIAVSMPLIYVAFFLCFRFKLKDHNISRSQRMAFLQVFAFSMMNTVACFIYVMMQFIEPIQWMVTFAQFSWLFIHGFPPVIYLLLNKTIRFEVAKMFYKAFDPSRISRIQGITVLVSGRHPPFSGNQVTPEAGVNAAPAPVAVAPASVS